MQRLARNLLALRPRAAAILLAALAALPSATAWSGDRWEPVPPEQLQATKPRVEAGADAEVLFWRVVADDQLREDEFTSERKTLVRVKVFTSRGAQRWCRNHVDAFGPNDHVTDIAARNLKPDGSVVEIARKDIVRERVLRAGSFAVTRYSFALPEVTPGCIVEYRYTRTVLHNRLFSESFPMQQDVPVQRVECWFSPTVVGMWEPHLVPRGGAEKPRQTKDEEWYIATANDVPAHVLEPDTAPGEGSPASVLLFYTIRNRGEGERLWRYYGQYVSIGFDEATRPSARQRSVADSLLADIYDRHERLAKLAGWVRTQFVDSLDQSAPLEPKLGGSSRGKDRDKAKLNERVSGAVTFAALARAAGFEIRPAFIAPRDGPRLDSTLTSPALLPGFAVAVRLPEGWTYFQPARVDLPWDLCSWEYEGATALLCVADSSRFAGTPLAPPERSPFVRTADLDLHGDGALTGTVHFALGGHWNEEQEEGTPADAKDNPDSLAARIELGLHSGATFSHVRVSDAPGRENPGLLGSADAHWDGASVVTARRILLQPSIFRANTPPRYGDGTRRRPLGFRNAWCEVDSVRIRIPAGWRANPVDFIDPVVAAGIGDLAAGVEVAEDGRSLLYVRRCRVGTAGTVTWEPAEFPRVRDFFDRVAAADRLVVELVPDPRGK